MINWIVSSSERRVFAAFFLYSVGLGGIFTRLADLQISMGILQGALGFALMGAALGAQISLMFAGVLLKKIGHRLGLLLFIPLLAFIQALATYSPTPQILFFVLALSGLALGSLEVIINLEADRVEHKIGKRIMNRAHAFWSFGFFVAGFIGIIAKFLNASPGVHLGLVALGVSVSVLVLFWDFKPAPARDNNKTPQPLISRPNKAILILVAFTLSAMLLEGASFDWSIIYMRDVFGATPFVATLAFSSGSLAQALVRYYADGFVDKYGAFSVGKTMIFLLGAGALLVTFAPNPSLAIFGFALMGAGTGTIFPLAMSAAAQRTDRPASTNVAALAQLSFLTFLLAPPALGYIGEHFGMRASFGVGLPLVIVSWLTLFAIKPSTKDPQGTLDAP